MNTGFQLLEEYKHTQVVLLMVVVQLLLRETSCSDPPPEIVSDLGSISGQGKNKNAQIFYHEVNMVSEHYLIIFRG